MRNGYDPTRRNRNIGTAKHGHGKDNRMVIPQSWHDDRVFYEKLRNPIRVTRRFCSVDITFFVEPPTAGCVHACTVDDVIAVLGLLPPEHRLLVKTFVFRQPTRKESQLRPVWGRVCYAAEFGRYSGVAVFLEAQNPDRPFVMSKSLDPLWQKRLEDLRRDGHEVVTTKRHHEIRSTLDKMRDTQLYSTLPHEVGHYVEYLRDFHEKVDHWAKPVRETEECADRYADEFRARALAEGTIPFDRHLNPHRLSRDGLNPKWFGC